ncbi:hydrogenase maturation protease [Streptomyces sp. NBC_01381]|uniref:hydrogenase maturation protease n=1 Tax=Streptomyces sp. NBC_01381 TaxID=2903845 RepID=UPI002252C717|nr:hydrogenase maturation protease [Streptomyces sp. NBC_01381]MCX4672995.1 hydrogenase maturation protease [Streptomyces sp. NBC_01381]
MTVSTRIAVIAVGDRSRHDDGVGWAVLSRLRERAAVRPLPPGTALSECDLDPGRLIRLWEDAGLAVVLESAHARPSRPGRIYRLELGAAELWRPGVMSPHGLGEAVELARELGRLPGHLVAYAVDSADISLGQGLSEPVAAMVEPLAERVEEEIVRHQVTAAAGAVASTAS